MCDIILLSGEVAKNKGEIKMKSVELEQAVKRYIRFIAFGEIEKAKLLKDAIVELEHGERE